ncbi:MAG: response regulator transcription factor [Methylorubrum extorquens]|uniref:Response regulator Input and output domains: CheY and HTH LuxR family n=2 Tax=Methylorubrum extorquens TaxID=408 RepID=C7CCW6_METED|nr:MULTISPECIES: response regulator transcription factor [Methylobacteriaceae]KQO96172.1 LuxR family transcriptional regulator [Methylobacterium sp. Leaf92]KQQ06897.1 LuxR family transcriptional regulator [Methylobacterium sp. Leaf122]WHQ68273.1 response regulator transcription factor [Methylorubrum extorquens]CAX25696.1 putative response regulator; Input and output domains: CheY and HTH LuxR family [Methylorubrum extorquens DM4]
MMTNILLVDDHPVVREGYRRLFERQPGFTVVAEAATAAEAYRLYKAQRPDLVILDLSLPGPSGIEAIRHIRQWDGAARILVFSMRTGAAIARQAFAAGASGYVSKASAPRELLAAAAGVLRGERAMSADIALAIAQDEVAGGRSSLDELSPREVEILGMTAAGATAQTIAEALCLSLKTVQNNLSLIRAKLGARTDAHLVWIAVGAGLVAAPHGPPAAET